MLAIKTPVGLVLELNLVWNLGQKLPEVHKIYTSEGTEENDVL